MSGNNKAINLALQGGGAHGAFTWGVIDRLLEDGRVNIEALSGSSAGAMNAVVYCSGHVRGGADGAREALENYWHAISRTAALSPVQRTPLDVLMGNWSLDSSPSYVLFDLISRLASPYDLNPLDFNPLRDILEDSVDFDAVRACSAIRLFISATNVHTGRVRVFRCPEITADVVMASACLPFLFKAVEIEGVPYWDGGYMGNPSLHPFFYECTTADLLLVQINPIERNETPKSAREILNRVNEITFNSSLQNELRSIDFVTRLLDAGQLEGGRYRRIHLHVIHGDEPLKEMSASSKVNAQWEFLTTLRDLGREAAGRWLDESFDKVGVRSSVNLREMFGGYAPASSGAVTRS
ncbi:MAG: patatin-like phospholipase family protein [Gammaproteobacteria bacterium]|nr:patatin-like phospholipase family protein [Gammaproteobacteria bacterium]NNL99553.1 patatin-like phospholipase family protein [Gammaproteobacteria bacterium]